MSLILNACPWNIRIQFECGWVPFIKNTLPFSSEFTWFPGCLVYQLIRIVLLKVFCTISIESVKDFYCLLLIGSQHEYFVTYVRSILHWPTHVYVSQYRTPVICVESEQQQQQQLVFVRWLLCSLVAITSSLFYQV